MPGFDSRRLGTALQREHAAAAVIDAPHRAERYSVLAVDGFTDGEARVETVIVPAQPDR